MEGTTQVELFISKLYMRMDNCIRIQKTSQFKSRLQHTRLWSAAAWPPRRLCYRPTVFFRLLRVTAVLFQWRSSKLIILLLFKTALVWICATWNCLNLGSLDYGIELWGCASNANIEILQRNQSEILRIITNAPRYVTNHTLHSDLHIPYVREVFQGRIVGHRKAIATHPNSLMAPLLHLPTTRRLKRRWTLDGTR
jgi:hypothetical protein